MLACGNCNFAVNSRSLFLLFYVPSTSPSSLFARVSCTSQKVPVAFNCKMPKTLMSLLEAGSSTAEIKELPLWLAKGLKKSNFLNTELPKSYGSRSLQKIKAGASSVSLGQHHPYFYDFGVEVSLLDETQDGMNVLKTLELAFGQRYKNILDRFHNTGILPSSPTSSFLPATFCAFHSHFSFLIPCLSSSCHSIICTLLPYLPSENAPHNFKLLTCLICSKKQRTGAQAST